MKILIVEDNERVARFVTRGLREAGHTVEHAANGRDGLFLAASEPHDVIVIRGLPASMCEAAFRVFVGAAGRSPNPRGGARERPEGSRLAPRR